MSLRIVLIRRGVKGDNESHVVRRQQAAVVLSLLAIVSRCGFALNPALEISQYAHRAWLSRDGNIRGKINAIAQTPDGYLWLGTSLGLVRFDGVRFVPFQFPESQRLPSDRIASLLSSGDGQLWIGTERGLASWKNGRLVTYRQLEGRMITSFIQDHEGRVWAGSSGGGLCVFRGKDAACDDDAGRVIALHQDSQGNLWLAASTGVWRWTPDKTQIDAVGGGPAGFAESGQGEILFGDDRGLRRIAAGKLEKYRLLGTRDDIRIRRIYRDRDGGIWMGTVSEGLAHLHQGKWDRFRRSDGLSGDFVRACFEDREGNIWVATSDGLDRFRAYAVPALSAQQGLSGSAYTVLASADGSVWIGTVDGLDRWKDGQMIVYRKRDGLPHDLVENLFQEGNRIWVSTGGGIAYFKNGHFRLGEGPLASVSGHIAGDSAGNIWITRNRQGLFHLTPNGAIESMPWSRLLQDPLGVPALAPDRARRGVWIGFYSAGLAFVKDGQIRAHYTSANGLGAGFVSSLRLEEDGVLWAATQGGLSRIKDARITTLTSRNGLPCDTVHWMMEDDDHFVWLYTACGLVRLSRRDLDAWVENPTRTIQTTHFDESDGVPSDVVTSLDPPLVTKTADGRLWFVNGSGVSIIDPRHLPTNQVQPPVHIESIIADDKPYDVKPGMRLPANVRNLRIEFTALSLVAPEKIHFKYKLEGQNRNWHEVINERYATYTNLDPKKYRFRVIASNNSNVWNETGDTVEFSIAPAWNQTTWFYAACVAGFFAMLWGLYRLRLYQIAREFNAQLDGRVDERLRVARELHDTMLQSFQAALIQMQAARNVFARRPEKAEQSLDKAISTTAAAIAEGRGAIQDLRLQPPSGGDLAQLLTTAGQELAHSDEAPGNPPAFRVTVEGTRQDLQPLLQDEVYRIARELLRNAFRHAQAGRIEAEIRYENRQLRVHVRDDGKGIDPEILKSGGRAGHWGLTGMRERANRFAGTLEFWSEAGAGTEAVLTVPGAVAYGASNGGRFWFLRRKKAGA
jgi:signal transduction histidine kinase/ligand-binding sensor domain-containing protein